MTGTVKIFIDSPFRSGSGCAAGTGNFIAGADFEFTSTPANPAQLDMRMYGDPPAPYTTEFRFANNADFVGTIYAPRSQFRANAATAPSPAL